ncbi:MAG: acyl-ACP desaturase [Actinobacteria bacterium]|nr:acyl-ACP desaturase [Actinomycetota bacterium]NCU80648.1 acyl-ACP desaturase [Acidimicrobiia bacterium]NBO97363.1 acyl-ACP desaturase [Actinomycetota bacterium]NBQ04097.1 acyl-ACP desaturase [Actinomycetota bacterium]NBQ44741.1 acyl-ACP desaturase [Actinomycetota bacterium]
MEELALLKEIEPVAEELLNRHLGVAKEWFPHEMIPYSRGKDFVPGEQWNDSDSDFGSDEIKMSDAVRGSLFVNLLTEDNLPYYSRDINRLFGNDGAYGEWGRNWTAEEGRHSIVIRDYLTVTRALDPVALERGRMQQVRGGQVPAPLDLFEAIAYVSMQELATRIAHRNTGKLIEDQVGEAIMSRVGNDENLHYLFYRDLTSAAIAVDPSSMVIGIERAVRTFAMPGTGIPDFERLSREIARAGIYDLLIHHDQILQPVVMRHWKLDQLTGLSDEAEKAREALFKRIDRIGKVGAKMASERVSA